MGQYKKHNIQSGPHVIREKKKKNYKICKQFKYCDVDFSIWNVLIWIKSYKNSPQLIFFFTHLNIFQDQNNPLR